MGLQITAKAQLGSKIQYPWPNVVGEDGERAPEKEMWYLNWTPDYENPANKEWALASPSLSFQMTVRGDVADKFVQGGKYTVTFELNEPEEKKEVPDGDGSA